MGLLNIISILRCESKHVSANDSSNTDVFRTAEKEIQIECLCNRMKCCTHNYNPDYDQRSIKILVKAGQAETLLEFVKG